jgi:glutaredoxin
MTDDATNNLPALTVYGAQWCSDCRRSERLLATVGVDYLKKDVEESAEYTEEARAISGRTNIPVILFADGVHLVEPSDALLHAELKLRNLI